LGLLILIFYSNSFTAGLLFDSDPIIRMDTRLRELSWTNLEQILTRNYWWPFQESNLYRPLTTLSYLFNYTILGNGANVGGYHAVNFLLHWTNTWLVLVIARRLSGRLDIATLTAGIFAIHPVNTEAVTNVIGRADLIATLCVLFGAWCYLQWAVPGERKGRWLAFLSVAACAGVLAKENGVMLVGFVVLYDLMWRGRSLRLKTAVQEFGPGYLALIPGLLLIWGIRRWMTSTAMVYEEFFTDNPLVGAAPFQGFMTALGVIGRYLKLLVFPWTLSPDYSFNQIRLYGTGQPGSDSIPWISAVAVLLCIVAAIYLRTRQRLFSWGVLFFFVMLLPTSNLILTIGSIMAERFLYLPSIGFCAASAVALCAINEKLKTRFGPALMWVLPISLISVLGIRTYSRNADWQDELSLWKSAVAASPSSFKARMVYGEALLVDAGRKTGQAQEQAVDDAIGQHDVALSILETKPPLPLKWKNITIYLDLAKAYRMKGQILQERGNQEVAMQFYEKSLAVLSQAQDLDRFFNQLSREFRQRRGIVSEEIPDTGNFFVYESLCFTYAKLGQWEKCETAGRYMQHIAPQQASAYQLVGTAYFNLGRYRDAAIQFLAGRLLEPANQNWGTALSATYDRLAVLPNPVSNHGTSYSLNREIPFVREQLNEAAAMLFRLFQEARKLDEARELRDRLMREEAVPPEVFSGRNSGSGV